MRMVNLSERFDHALLFARRLHEGQVRKGTEIPYIAHLLAVAALVLEDGGDEEQGIAALLHDAVEDQGGYAVLDQIRAEFGPRVADIVEGLSDSFVTPKPPWQERKEKYLRHLPEASEEVLRVSLADKVHNARSLLHDLRVSGPATWERFNGKRQGTLWYYRSLVKIFECNSTSPMVAELRRVVEELEQVDKAQER